MGYLHLLLATGTRSPASGTRSPLPSPHRSRVTQRSRWTMAPR